jgi:hypothetical protein
VSKWLSSKTQTATNICKNARKKEHLYTVGMNATFYNHYGKQYRRSSNN